MSDEQTSPHCDVKRFGIPYLICNQRATCVAEGTSLMPIPLCAHHRHVAENAGDMNIVSMWYWKRGSGVALMRVYGDGAQRFDDVYRREAPGYPRDVKYRVMQTKANGIMNGYYIAKIGAIQNLFGDAHWNWPQWRIDRVTIPEYTRLRSMLLDGDFTDDGDPTGGDYILACRIALAFTKDRHDPGPRMR